MAEVAGARSTAALRTVGLREGATLFMTLLGAWVALLHQLSRQEEVIIGTPVRGRNLPELEQVMGFFVNALPLRLRVDDGASFLDLLRHVRAETVEAFSAQDVPFEHLVRALDTKRDESRFPIYQAFFSYQDARQRPPKWGDLEHHNLPVFQPSAAQDVALWFLDGVDGLVGGLNYNTDILERRHRGALAQQVPRTRRGDRGQPRSPAARVARRHAEERAQLVAWNQTERPLTPDANLTALFAPLAARTARASPSVIVGASVTYAELAARRDRVSRQPWPRVVSAAATSSALLVERTPFMVAALLGMLAAGATYLPLDPQLPAVSGSRSCSPTRTRKVVITDVADTGELGLDAARMLRLDRELARGAGRPAGAARRSSPDDAAYLIYTSGSTGKPKGVARPASRAS